MALDPFTEGFSLAHAVLDKIFPDADAKLKGQIEQAAQELDNEFKIQLGQISTNTEEAKHTSVFVAGARPAAMWVGVITLAYSGIGTSLLTWIAAIFGLPPIPLVDPTATNAILTGLLGLGGMRTVEKMKGVDSKFVGAPPTILASKPIVPSIVSSNKPTEARAWYEFYK